ncbi:hypothetical protein PM082_003738 [Marasmius tenuissimus]|nr:hypothetical protein PM082_003738 [Marasmius tenuissimus]
MPVGGCRQSFVSRSALILHLENSRCPSRVDKVTVDQYVRNLDTANIITDPSRMIAGSESHCGHPVTTYSATEASWNGRAYERYLCQKGHRTLTSLNQHLASPCHQESLYFCPLTTCRVRFTILSGLCQHIESQKCGVSKFREVQQVMDGFSSYMSSRLLMV